MPHFMTSFRAPLAAFAAAAALAPVLALAPATAAPSAAAGSQVVTIAGGPHDLVWARTSGGPSAVVHLLDQHGKTGRLGRFNLSGSDATRFSLVGSTLVGAVVDAQNLDPTHVRWWDLAHHTLGTMTVPRNAIVDGAVRGGVLYEVPSTIDAGRPTTVVIESLSGKRTTLHHPFGQDPDIAYLGAPHGIVAVDYDRATAAMKYARYGHHFHPLAGGGAYSSGDAYACYSATGSLVTCTKQLPDGTTLGYGIPLGGSKAVVVAGKRPVGVGATLVYRSHRLVFRPLSGKVARSRVRGTPVAAAFGAVVLQNHSHTVIRSLAAAHDRPKVLVRA